MSSAGGPKSSAESAPIPAVIRPVVVQPVVVQPVIVQPVVQRFFEFALLGMLASGYLAVFASGFLDWPTAAAMFLALCTRALLAAGIFQFHFPSRWGSALAVAYLGFFPIDYYYLSGTFLVAIVHMVFFLAVLKLLTAETARDFGYLKVIAGLELISAAVLSSGLSFLLFLLIFLLFGIATFAGAEVRRVADSRVVVSKAGLRAFSRRLGLMSLSLFAGILILSAGLFFVLPRTARAAIERLIPLRYHMAGFSNSVTLGEIGELKQSNTAVMHVRSFQEEGFPPVKWRGAALSEFDGKRWFNPPGNPSGSLLGEERMMRVDAGVLTVRSAVQGTRQGRSLIYRVRVEPMAGETLFLAGTPETISIDVPVLRYGPNGAFHVPPRFGGRALNYSVYAFLPNEWAEVRFTSSPLGERERQELLSLPALDPRIPALARQMTNGIEGDIEQSRALELHLRQDYGYTLELLSKPVADPLAFFLFDRKKGHCEYFASAMTVMLRTLGIPSRVVTGFQSGVYNPMTGWQVIRAADAHSWVEAWLEGRGWTTFDPTPYATSSGDSALLAKIALLEDAAAQYFQDWVVSYDLGHQVALFSRMQSSRRKLSFPDFDDLASAWKEGMRKFADDVLALAILAAITVVAFLFGPGLIKWWRSRARVRRMEHGQGDKADATILYEEMLAKLKQQGFQKPPWLTPVEFVRVLPTSQMSALVEDATVAYNELRFGGRSDAAPRFVRVIEQIRQL